MTSEQSIRSSLLWPRIDIFTIAAAKALRIASWFSTKLCQVHAVRESRASSASDWRRISPRSGDITSPWFPLVPGKRVPFNWVSMKNWLSKTPGVESKGEPGIVSSTWSAAAIEWEASSATTSSGLNPASAKRSRILSTESIFGSWYRSGI